MCRQISLSIFIIGFVLFKAQEIVITPFPPLDQIMLGTLYTHQIKCSRNLQTLQSCFPHLFYDAHQIACVQPLQQHARYVCIYGNDHRVLIPTWNFINFVGPLLTALTKEIDISVKSWCWSIARLNKLLGRFLLNDSYGMGHTCYASANSWAFQEK